MLNEAAMSMTARVRNFCVANGLKMVEDNLNPSNKVKISTDHKGRKYWHVYAIYGDVDDVKFSLNFYESGVYPIFITREEMRSYGHGLFTWNFNYGNSNDDDYYCYARNEEEAMEWIKGHLDNQYREHNAQQDETPLSVESKVSKAIKMLKENHFRIVEDAYTDAMDAEDDEYLAKMKANTAEAPKAIANVRVPRRAKPTMGNNPYKVGDILMMHWGYSMCLYDYFKVVKVTPNSVGLVELKDIIVKGHKNGQYYNAPSDEIETRPIFCNDDGSPTMKRVSPSGSVTFGHTGVAVKWDGEPHYCDDMD